MDWQTLGHENVKNILNKQILSGFLPHAYLFSGPEGVGKKTLALELASKILDTKNLTSHPDFQILDVGDDEITMELVLDFISRMGYKAFVGGKKVAIINNAQNLNPKSSNALLKTLEEASAGSVIILISSSARLLPTIVSRCQVFNFFSFSKPKLSEFGKLWNLVLSDEQIDLSFGSPSRLKKLCKDKAFLESELLKVGQFKKIIQANPAERLVYINEMVKDEGGELENVLTTWLYWQMSVLKERPAGYVRVQALSDAILGLRQNFNKKLVLQGLFLKV